MRGHDTETGGHVGPKYAVRTAHVGFVGLVLCLSGTAPSPRTSRNTGRCALLAVGDGLLLLDPLRKEFCFYGDLVASNVQSLAALREILDARARNARLKALGYTDVSSGSSLQNGGFTAPSS